MKSASEKEEEGELVDGNDRVDIKQLFNNEQMEKKADEKTSSHQ